MRKIDKVILHCSDSDIAAHDDIKVIKKWHLARKFKDVGYHYFIRKDGLIQKGRDILQVGAHCKGENSTSIGICLSGRYKFTDYQFIALERLIAALNIRLNNCFTIHPHNEFSDKSCPNFSVEEFKIKYIDKCQPTIINVKVADQKPSKCD